MSCEIKHTGTVVAVESHVVTVRVEQLSACAGCASQASCSLSTEKRNETLTIPCPNPTQFSVGETVWLVGTKKTIYTAVLLAYILPVIGLMVVVIACVQVYNNEILAAIMGLVFCAIYAGLLLFLPKRLTQTLQINIEKII